MTMRVLLIVLMTLAPALAGAAETGCLRPNEMKAESNLRLALMMRERARVCAFRSGNDEFAKLPAQWSQFEQQNDKLIRDMVQTREAAIGRVYKSRPKEAEAQVGRLIARFRQEPAYTANCRDIARTMSEFEKSGWGAFQKKARLFDSEVKLDSPPCG